MHILQDSCILPVLWNITRGLTDFQAEVQTMRIFICVIAKNVDINSCYDAAIKDLLNSTCLNTYCQYDADTNLDGILLEAVACRYCSF